MRSTRFGLLARISLLLPPLLCAGTAPGQPLTLYATGPFDPPGSSNLLRVDSLTGAATLVGSTGVLRPRGIDFGPDGTLHATDGTRLFTLDLSTGAATPGPILTTDFVEGGVAFRPGTAEFYYMEGREDRGLYRLNLQTGAATRIGPHGLQDRDFSAIAFDAGGTLYAIHSNDTTASDVRLARVDLATGAATDLGALGNVDPHLGAGGVAGFDFDPATNVGYFTTGSELYTLNPNTRAVTLVGSMGVPRVSGLAVYVPEPGALTLACLAALLWGRRTHRR